MYAHPYIQAKCTTALHIAASRRICRDKYLDIICQFYVFVASAAVATATDTVATRSTQFQILRMH